MIFQYLCVFIYLAALGLSCGMEDLQLWHVGSSSLTRDQTQAPYIWEQAVLATVPPWKPRRQTFIQNELSVLYLHRSLRMNGQGTPLEVKMMKSPAEECGAAATSRPWEMKTAVTRTPAPSLLPKWLREGKAISRRLSHPSQNSPLSSKCFQYSTSGTHFLVLSLMIQSHNFQSKCGKQHPTGGAAWYIEQSIGVDLGSDIHPSAFKDMASRCVLHKA